MKQLLILLALLLALGSAWAQGTDDLYLRIYGLIQEANSLSETQPAQALAKYLEAQTTLQRLQKGDPNWNTSIVKYRLEYIAGEIAALSARVPGGTNAVPRLPSNTAQPAASAGAGTAALENQLRQLQNQVAQLQNEKSTLEAKLKEAFALRPAEVDPRLLAKADERIKVLLKENELLKASLEQKAQAAPSVNTKALEDGRQALAEAERKLAAQTDQAKQLTKEKEELQTKLNNLHPGKWNTANVERTQKSLDETKRELADQKLRLRDLTIERDELQKRVKALTKTAESASALRQENEQLKTQLASLKSTKGAEKPDDLAKQLAEVKAQVAALQSDKDLLRLEKLALENRVKQLTATPGSAPAPEPSGRSDDINRVRQLEQERDDLQNKLAAANQQLAKGSKKKSSSQVRELEQELANLRSRLQVFEAQRVPYTPEELALFKQPDTKLSAATGGKRPTSELPAGTASLVAEAQRYFSERQLDKAEQVYLQVLRKDEKNVPTLANLAAIQLEQNHLADAEKNARKAVALAPEDAYSLSVLGHVKFVQGKYDEALDTLSQAAKLDPENATIQNYLGLTLSEKGMRGPAETALRRAIQLEPTYGDAHNNLAVIYLTQTPPLVELARWHYNKALAAGNARNPPLEKMLEQKAARQ